MVITEVTLNNYRNWTRLFLEPHSRLNVLTGSNAQGKSNLLEALYTLVTTRPYRALRDVEVIRFGEGFAHVHAAMTGGGRNVSCEILWQKDADTRGSPHPPDYTGVRVRKEIRLNRQPVQRLVDVFGVARMVLFAPRDLELVTGPPEFRRRYLDILLSQLHPSHLYALGQYQKVVTERNRYLRQQASESRPGSATERAAMSYALDDQLIRWGSELMERRSLSLEKLSPILEKLYRTLGGKTETIRLRYLPSARGEPGETCKEALSRHIRIRAREELARGLTLVGPHRDDLEIILNGHPMRLFGSQGQLRSMALAMRLAEGEMLEREGGEAPVLLLDDCLSEMDPSRQAALWNYLGEREQIFLTTCQWPERVPLPVEGTLYRVADNCVIRSEESRCNS